jgi:hypothetical protein
MLKFLSDVRELHRLCKTAIRLHRAQFDEPFMGEEQLGRARSRIQPHQLTIQEALRRRRKLRLSRTRPATPGLELQATGLTKLHMAA